LAPKSNAANVQATQAGAAHPDAELKQVNTLELLTLQQPTVGSEYEAGLVAQEGEGLGF
jgi:hypothetical protein